MRLAKDLRKKIREHINLGFTDALAAAFRGKFELELESSYNIFAMALVSRRVDEKDFTPEQAAFVSAYEAGYTDAMQRLEPPSQGGEPK